MGETPNLKSDEKPVAAGALRVTCPHCGAHGEAVDMVEFVGPDGHHPMVTDVFNAVADAWHGALIVGRFTCCGLWGDLAVAEPTPEETA